MQYGKFKLTEESLKNLNNQFDAAAARGARANAAVENSKGNTEAAKKWTAQADEIDNKTGISTTPTPVRQYVRTGNTLTDLRNQTRVAEGLVPSYSNPADMRNQMRLDQGLGISKDITPVLTQYHNYLADSDERVKTIDAEIKKLSDEIDKHNKYLEAGDYDNYDYHISVNNGEKIKQLQNEKQRIEASKNFAKENTAFTLAAIAGDADLITQYWNAHNNARATGLLGALESVLTGGRAMPGSKATQNTTAAYDRENELARQLKEKGYTDEQLQAFLNVKNSEMMQNIVQETQEFAKAHPVLGTAASVATAPVRGALGVAGMVMDPGTKNSPFNILNELSSTVQDTVKNDIVTGVTEWGGNVFGDSKIGQFAADKLGKGVGFVYSAAVSSVESYLSMQMGGALGELLLGMNAASSTYYDALENGLGNFQAMTTAMTSGVFEAVFEHLSLENLRGLKASDGRGMKTLIGNVVKSFITEGSEEVATDLANELWDYFANGGLSEYERYVASYMEENEGSTREQAEAAYRKKFLKQLGESMIVGGLSGAMHAGVYGARNEIRGAGTDIRTGKALTELGNNTEGGVGEVLAPLTDQLKATAEAELPDGATRKQRQQQKQAGKTLSALESINEKTGNRKAGRAVNEALNQFSVTQHRVMNEALQDAGMTDKNARNDLINAYENMMFKGIADRDSLKTLREHEDYIGVLNELTNAEGVEGVIGLRTDLANAMTKNKKQKSQTAKELNTQEIAQQAETTIKEHKADTLVKTGFKATTADGATVETGAVKGIEDGKLQVVIDKESGATANLDELTFVDAGGETLEKIQNMMSGDEEYRVKLTTDGANMMLALLNETDVDADTALQDLYNAYAKGSVLGDMDTMMRETGYDISTAAINAMYTAGAANYAVKPGVTRIGSAQLSKNVVDEIAVIDAYAKDNGLNIVVTDELYGEIQDSKGQINTLRMLGQQSEDVIVVSLHSGQRENVLSLTAFHETFHWLGKQGELGARYQQNMIKSIIGYLKSSDKYDYDEIRQQRLDRGYSEDKVDEEIAAQFFGTILAEEAFRKYAAETDAPLWKKIIDHVKAFLENIRQRIEQRFAGDKAVQAALMSDMDEIRHFIIAFEVALEDVTETRKKGEITQTETGGDYSFAGIGSETADESLLEQAQEMEEDGADSEEIRQATGWFKGYDGKWRYEIDDSKIKINKKAIKTGVFQKLSDIVTHEELFSAYPFLKNINVLCTDLGGAEGAYDPDLNRMVLDEKLLSDTDELTDTMLHELQHAVQEYEKFTGGASIEYWEEQNAKQKAKKLAALDEARREMNEIRDNMPGDYDIHTQFGAVTFAWTTRRSLQQGVSDQWKEQKQKRELAEVEKIIDENGWRHVLDDYTAAWDEVERTMREANIRGQNALTKYWNTAGEIEARDTGARAKMTSEQRKETRPDIDRTDVVFADGDTANSEDLGGAEENIIKQSADLIDYSLEFAESGEHAALIEQAWTSDAAMPKSTVTERYEKIIDIWKKIGGELHSDFLNAWDRKTGKDRAFEIFKAQSGYKYNAELASMCKKGIALFDAIDVIVKDRVMEELGIKELGKHEKEILYDILKDHGHEIPCAICYVEQARQREGAIISDFVNGNKSKKKLGWNEALDKIEEKMKAQGIEYKFTTMNIADADYAPADVVMTQKEQDAFYKAVYELVNEEITTNNKTAKVKRALAKDATPKAIMNALKGSITLNMRVYKSLVNELQSRYKLPAYALYSSVATQNIAKANHELYKTFNMQGGVSGYKTKQTPVVYWGDILRMSAKPESVRKAGGIRWQSNSDSQMYTFLDRVQYFVDMTGKGYYHQEYTKVPASLKLFGLMGGKQNASLIPAMHVYRNADGSVNEEKTRENAGLDENGNPIYDKMEGIDPDEAFLIATDREYSKNVGTICVGYSDKHIRKLLDDARISMIIGFHDKTDNPEKRYRGARYAHNYRGENEAKNAKGETVHIDFSKYLIKAEKKFKKSGDAFAGTTVFEGNTYTADEIPRLAADIYLAELAAKGWTPAYSQFADHENYYKLLADFRLVDAEGHYAPHRPVKFFIPETVPVRTVDGNGNARVERMPTEEYIKTELEKELRERDAIARDLADDSAKGIIPQFKKAISEEQKTDYSADLDQEYMDAVEIDARSIDPMNEITDQGKYKYLVNSFEESGWQGRPVVIVENENNGYVAITGSHRIYAAREADIPVKAVVLEYREELDDLVNAYSGDDAREKEARRLEEENIISKEVADLIAREEELNNINYGVDYADQTRWSADLESEAIDQLEETAEKDPKVREQLQNVQALYDAYRKASRQKNGKIPTEAKLRDIVQKYVLNDPNNKTHGDKMTEEVIRLLNDVMDGNISFTSFAYAVRGMMQYEAENAGHWEVIGDVEKQKDYRKNFRDGKNPKTVYLDTAAYDQIAKKYGGRNELRKATFGRLTLTTDEQAGAQTLGEFYDSLSERYDLPQAETPLEQLTNMLAKYKEDTRIWIDDNVSGNFGKSQDEVVDDMTTAFMTDILESANVLNGVDTELYTARIAELRKEIDNAKRRRIDKVVSDAQAALRKQLDDIIEDESKTTDEVQNESQRATDTATREALAKAYQERMRAYEAETRRSHQTEQERKDIRRRLRKLKDMLLKNTKTQNIPQPLKKTVKNIIIDFLEDEDIFTPLEREYIAKDLMRLKTPEVNGPTFDFTRFSDALRENYNQMKEDMKNAGQIFGVGMTLKDMTPKQVDITNAFVENVMYVVQNAGKTFLDERNGNIFTDGERTIKDLRKMLEGMNDKQKKRTQKLIRSMMNNDYMTSFYFFKEHMGGTVGEYFDAITTAESNEGLMLKQIETFFTDLKKELDYDKEKWDKQTHMLHLATYESRTDGNNPLPVISIDNWDVELTTEACMEVYAWYRREMMSGQESSHIVPYINEDNEISGGGVVLDNELIKAQGKLERAAQEVKGQAKATRGNEEYQKFLKERGDAINVAADKNRHMLTESAVEAIIGTLTDKQKAYVERVTDFLSNVMGEYGNEATMKWYGVRFFEEDYYFPYESPAEFSSRRYGLTNEKRLGNWGPTHRTQVYAHTPLVLSNFSEVAARHAYEMATYSEFLIPIEQMTNLLSYSNLDGQDASIQSMIKSVYGDRAMSYINDFMNQINGGVKGDEADSFINRMTGKFKAGAVMANASVVAQQPSAIMRAGAIMNPSHFFKTIGNMGLRKADYQEMMNHSGVAVIKEIGGFDTDLGRGIAKTLSGEEGKMDKVNDFLGWGAEKADALTWTWIWNAVKHEVTENNNKTKHEYVYDATNERHRRIAQTLLRTDTELQEGTEAFDKAIRKELFLDDVRKRFEEVIHYTQVYDSVISKNRWMRSQSGLVKMVTAFMAEPTLSLNMLMMSGKNHTVHKGRAIAAFAANIIVNSMLRSIVSMWRKREEDETYFEAWLREMTGDLIGDYHVLFLDGAWSPFGMIPLVKDIISLVQGYDVERSDISVIGDVIEDMNDILDSIKANDKDITTWAYPEIDQLKDLAFDAAKIFGVPVGNIYRDGEGIYKMFSHWIQDPKWEIDGNALTEALKKGIGIEQSDEYRAYKGILNNDTELIKRMTAPDEKTYNRLLGQGYNEEEAMKQAEYDAKDKFDKLCADGLIRYDPEERANRAAAYLISGTADGLKMYDELRQDMIDDGFSNNTVMKAINKCVNNLKPQEEKESKEKDELDPYTMTYLDFAIEANDAKSVEHITEQLLEQGSKKENVNKHIKNKILEMFDEGDIEANDAQKMLMNYVGLTEKDAEAQVDYRVYSGDNAAPDLDMADWHMYTKPIAGQEYSIRDKGITPEVFSTYRTESDKCTADVDASGKTISGSKKVKVMAVIDSLPITKEQKDALYFLNDWSKNTLYEAPWH